MRARRPSGSVVLAYLALFIALGGVAFAGATVGPGDIETDAVRSRHILNTEVHSAEIADDSTGFALTGANVRPDSLTTFDVDESTLFNDNSIDGTQVDESTLAEVPSAGTADNADNALKLGGRPVADFIADRAGDVTFLEPVMIDMALNGAPRVASLGEVTLEVRCALDAITNAESLVVRLTTTANNTIVHNLVSHGTSSSTVGVSPAYSENDDLDSNEAFFVTADVGDTTVSVGNDQGTLTYLNPSSTTPAVITLTYLAEAQGGRCQFAGTAARARAGS